MFWSIIGSTAAFLTMFGFVPQIVKVLKTKSAHDISLTTLLQFFLGVCFWIAYGVHLGDPIIIIANSVTLFTLFVLLFLYRINR